MDVYPTRPFNEPAPALWANAFESRRRISSARMSLAQISSLLGMAPPGDARMNEVCFPIKQYRRGDAAFREGRPFGSIYAVVEGRFKTVSVQPSGHEQVMAVLLRGDVAGLEAAGLGVHRTSLVALESSRLAIVPLATLRGLARDCREVEALIYCAFQQEIDRGLEMLGLLGTPGAKAGVAAFLISLASRLDRCGATAEHVKLPLSRLEIAQLLGTTQETVCRSLSTLASMGLIRVAGHRTVTIVNRAGLATVAQSGGRAEPARSDWATAPAAATTRQAPRITATGLDRPLGHRFPSAAR